MNINKIQIVFFVLLIYSCAHQDVKKEYFPNGKVQIELTVLSEIENCLKEYYSNGNLKMTSCLKNNKLNGSVKKYYKNGQLKDSSFYDTGTLIGERRLFNNDGTIEQISHYYLGANYYSKSFIKGVFQMEVLSPIISMDTIKSNINAKNYVLNITLPFIDSLKLPFLEDDVTSYFLLSRNDKSEEVVLNDSTEMKVVLNKNNNHKQVGFHLDSIGTYFFKGLSYYSSNDSSLYYTSFPIRAM